MVARLLDLMRRGTEHKYGIVVVKRLIPTGHSIVMP